jgi:hypothetical protein
MQYILRQQINMTNLNCSEPLSENSLEKLQAGLKACSLIESHPDADLDRIDSGFEVSSASGVDSECESSFDSETDASSQSPYNYNPLTKVRRWPSPLGGKWTGKNIIILSPSPSSTAFSSPTSGCSDTTAFFSSESEEPQQQPLSDVHLNIISVSDWVTSLQRLTATHASFTLICEVEQALLNHLHTHPATLVDVQALIPNLSFRPQITHKLATNIGLNHARGAIPESAVEEMLIHMLTHDAPDLMARTRNQIARFRREREERAWCRMSNKQRRQHARYKGKKSNFQAKKEAEDDLTRRQSLPARYREKSEHAPYGCESIADIIVQDCMGWAQVQLVREYAMEEFMREMGMEVKLKTVEVDVVEEKFWCQTRLHNGPGLTDRKRPKVRLARACPVRVGRVVVGTKVGGCVGVEVRSKASSEGLFTNCGEGAHVRLPSC